MWPPPIPCGSGLARESGGSAALMVTDTPSSRASPLLHWVGVTHKKSQTQKSPEPSLAPGFFESRERLFAEHLTHGRVLEQARQRVAKHIADQFSVGFLVRRHTETLIQGSTVTAAVTTVGVLHIRAEGRADGRFSDIHAFFRRLITQLRQGDRKST